ncbi:MAG: amidohydrolase family protein [Verrucomicrobiae bacterium]|nr:amidohydrolase family protein [Verrucomicrobiae bacterium]
MANVIPIIDTHQHLWDLTKLRPPWLEKAGKLNRSFVMADYLEATAGLNVVKTVYMEVGVAPADRIAEAEYVTDLCQRADSPMVAAVISGSPDAPDFGDYLKRFKDNRYIKGLRSMLHRPDTPAGTCLKSAYVRGVQRLGEIGWSFDICIRAANLSDAARLVDACPGTRFILDHCGNANVQWAANAPEREQWQHDIAQLARRKQIVCKISGIVASAKPDVWKPDDLAPYVKHCIAEFGWDRVMFAGDWPVCTKTATFKQWVQALQTIVADATEEQKRKLFHDNAVRFYRI